MIHCSKFRNTHSSYNMSAIFLWFNPLDGSYFYNWSQNIEQGISDISPATSCHGGSWWSTLTNHKPLKTTEPHHAQKDFRWVYSWCPSGTHTVSVWFSEENHKLHLKSICTLLKLIRCLNTLQVKYWLFSPHKLLLICCIAKCWHKIKAKYVMKCISSVSQSPAAQKNKT